MPDRPLRLNHSDRLQAACARRGCGNVGNHGAVVAGGPPLHGQPHSATLVLPPLAVLWLKPVLG